MAKNKNTQSAQDRAMIKATEQLRSDLTAAKVLAMNLQDQNLSKATREQIQSFIELEKKLEAGDSSVIITNKQHDDLLKLRKVLDDAAKQMLEQNKNYEYQLNDVLSNYAQVVNNPKYGARQQSAKYKELQKIVKAGGGDISGLQRADLRDPQTLKGVQDQLRGKTLTAQQLSKAAPSALHSTGETHANTRSSRVQRAVRRVGADAAKGLIGHGANSAIGAALGAAGFGAIDNQFGLTAKAAGFITGGVDKFFNRNKNLHAIVRDNFGQNDSQKYKNLSFKFGEDYTAYDPAFLRGQGGGRGGRGGARPMPVGRGPTRPSGNTYTNPDRLSSIDDAPTGRRGGSRSKGGGGDNATTEAMKETFAEIIELNKDLVKEIKESNAKLNELVEHSKPSNRQNIKDYNRDVDKVGGEKKETLLASMMPESKHETLLDEAKDKAKTVLGGAAAGWIGKKLLRYVPGLSRFGSAAATAAEGGGGLAAAAEGGSLLTGGLLAAAPLAAGFAADKIMPHHYDGITSAVKEGRWKDALFGSKEEWQKQSLFGWHPWGGGDQPAPPQAQEPSNATPDVPTQAQPVIDSRAGPATAGPSDAPAIASKEERLNRFLADNTRVLNKLDDTLTVLLRSIRGMRQGGAAAVVGGSLNSSSGGGAGVGSALPGMSYSRGGGGSSGQGVASGVSGGGTPSSGGSGGSPRSGGSNASPSQYGGGNSPMPTGGGEKSDPKSIKGLLFKGESGGNPGIANYMGSDGRYHVTHFDSENETIGSLMQKQSSKQIFAAGKYQMIPATLKEGVKALGLKPTDKFDSATQDRLYTDYLAGSKRPAISNYITGKEGSSVGKAADAAAMEWASVGFRGHNGESYYNKDGHNKASISVDQMESSLKQGRETYERLIKEGKDPEFARRSALLGIQNPQGGKGDMPTAPKTASTDTKGPESRNTEAGQQKTPGDGKSIVPDSLTPKSRRELSGINKELANNFIEASKRSGIQFQVTQGMRDQAEANANARSGRGVSNSQHLYGAAADLKLIDPKTGQPSMDRSLYEKFGSSFNDIAKEQGTSQRWLGSLKGRWGKDYVHFDQGIGYGQSHERNPFGMQPTQAEIDKDPSLRGKQMAAVAPTKADIAEGNKDAYTSPGNPFGTKTAGEAAKAVVASNAAPAPAQTSAQSSMATPAVFKQGNVGQDGLISFGGPATDAQVTPAVFRGSHGPMRSSAIPTFGPSHGPMRASYMDSRKKDDRYYQESRNKDDTGVPLQNLGQGGIGSTPQRAKLLYNSRTKDDFQFANMGQGGIGSTPQRARLLYNSRNKDDSEAALQNLGQGGIGSTPQRTPLVTEGRNKDDRYDLSERRTKDDTNSIPLRNMGQGGIGSTPQRIATVKDSRTKDDTPEATNTRTATAKVASTPVRDVAPVQEAKKADVPPAKTISSANPPVPLMANMPPPQSVRFTPREGGKHDDKHHKPKRHVDDILLHAHNQNLFKHNTG